MRALARSELRPTSAPRPRRRCGTDGSRHPFRAEGAVRLDVHTEHTNLTPPPPPSALYPANRRTSLCHARSSFPIARFDNGSAAMAAVCVRQPACAQLCTGKTALTAARAFSGPAAAAVATRSRWHPRRWRQRRPRYCRRHHRYPCPPHPHPRRCHRSSPRARSSFPCQDARGVRVSRARAQGACAALAKRGGVMMQWLYV